MPEGADSRQCSRLSQLSATYFLQVSPYTRLAEVMINDVNRKEVEEEKREM